ncbi:MAG: hypothetical protein IBX52_09400 [Bacterioplanes sp.]|nr:hypothetical protein [Bacterioplanes sp.]
MRSFVGLSDDNQQANAEQARPDTQQPQAVESGESGRGNRGEQGTQAKADESTRPEQDLLSDYTEQDLAVAE